MFNLHILITYAATSEEHREIEQALNGLERLLNGIGTVMATTLAPVKVEYLLFFDGGSRGNPGPGGADSVLLQIDIVTGWATIRWVASMSYQHSSTTNNMAEYWGLVHGLRYAREHNCEPLHVAGDSCMIIRQQLNHKAPRNARLRRLFQKTQQLANSMCIRTWTHHLRAYNKMADLAANHAMDNAVSRQYTFPTTRADGQAIQQHVDNDFSYEQGYFCSGKRNEIYLTLSASVALKEQGKTMAATNVDVTDEYKFQSSYLTEFSCLNPGSRVVYRRKQKSAQLALANVRRATPFVWRENKKWKRRGDQWSALEWCARSPGATSPPKYQSRGKCRLS
ncbi:reverse transcriptase, partial [Globisporangium splendens]